MILAAAIVATALAAQHDGIDLESPPTIEFAAPCRSIVGVVRRNESGSIGLYPWDCDDIFRWLNYFPSPVDAGGKAVEPIDAVGRRTSYCEVHQNCPMVVLGGMSAEDYDFSVALARSAEDMAADLGAARPAEARDRALVRAGLGSEYLATRKAAHRQLDGRGERAILALLGGLESRDAEVRLRCVLILDLIRSGPTGCDDDD